MDDSTTVDFQATPTNQLKSKRYNETQFIVEFLRHGGMDERSQDPLRIEPWCADYGQEMLRFLNEEEYFHQVGHFLGYVRTDDQNQPVPYFEEDLLEIVWRFHNKK